MGVQLKACTIAKQLDDSLLPKKKVQLKNLYIHSCLLKTPLCTTWMLPMNGAVGIKGYVFSSTMWSHNTHWKS